MKQSVSTGSEQQQARQFQPNANGMHAGNSSDFVDNRPETIALRQLKDTILSNPKTIAQRNRTEQFHNMSRGKLNALQRIKEEKPLQGKFATAQRRELGIINARTVQRKEQEAEKPLPGSVVPSQELGDTAANTIDGVEKAPPLKPMQAAPTPKSGTLPTDPAAAAEIEQRALEVEAAVQALMKQSADTLSLQQGLSTLAEAYRLKDIRLKGVGHAKPKVVFEINPTYEVAYDSGSSIGYRMLGSGTGEATQTNALFKTGSITLGTASATVGREMIANPLSQDHQPGSDSNKDSDQDSLMKQLANSGNTGVPNHSKYIKGHLLNHDVGGPGNAINLYPITADANDKHLKFVEKWVKSSVQAGYVCYYHVKVDGESISHLPSGKYQVDSNFNFDFFRYSIDGNPVPGSRHQGSIQSRYLAYGEKPYGIAEEFGKSGSPEASKLDEGKGTPKAAPLGGEQTKTVSGYKLQHPAGKGFITGEASGKPLPAVYGGSGTLGFSGITLAHSPDSGEANVLESFTGDTVVQPIGSPVKRKKSWQQVRIYLSQDKKIPPGTVGWMSSKALKKGIPFSSSVQWLRPINLSDSIGGINSGAIYTFFGGAGVALTRNEYGSWVQVSVIHSLDDKLSKGIVAWMKAAWLE
ncbi:hypothetical protein [Nitrosomonas sp.]|uniref:hypothetical protein n=1 Tax=Nitrosomonas sp. TaxID=42353 RepID=UPI0032EFB6F6